MERPTEICETCFDKNRVTHKAGDGYELIGTYCTHTGTGAQADRREEVMSEWFINHGIGERSFWHVLRLTARFERGDITKAQLKAEMMTFARKNGNK